MARSESELINVLRTKDKLTEKGMVTNSTSLDACVDMFFMAGASRHWSKEKKQNLFQKAFVENPLIAMKLLFWTRDVRRGAGERDFFRVCSDFLFENYNNILIKNLKLIPEYGRWDDLSRLLTDTSCNNESDIGILNYIKDVLYGDLNKIGLLAKWSKRKGYEFNKIRNFLKLSPKAYRKLIVGLSNTIEQKMCDKKFGEIDYKTVPSVAMNKYRTSFYRNDENRFKMYIDDVKSGKSKINSKAIYPHMLYHALTKSGRADMNTFKIIENDAIEAQWKSLPNYMEGSKHRILPIVDVSPSMTWLNGLPIEVAISLGIYISERNESVFKDAFMTFSDNPTIEFLKGSFAERAYQLRCAKWGRTTNIERSFELLLDKSVEYNIEEKYMPTVLLIISDMQFDRCKINDTAVNMIREKYKRAGYTLPQIIFWNVRAEIDNVPVEDNEHGVGLVSGFNTGILKNILNVDIKRKPTPLETMLSVVNSDRYDLVSV